MKLIKENIKKIMKISKYKNTTITLSLRVVKLTGVALVSSSNSSAGRSILSRLSMSSMRLRSSARGQKPSSARVISDSCGRGTDSLS